MYVCALGGGTEGITRVVGIERIKVPRSRAGSGRGEVGQGRGPGDSRRRRWGPCLRQRAEKGNLGAGLRKCDVPWCQALQGCSMAEVCAWNSGNDLRARNGKLLF